MKNLDQIFVTHHYKSNHNEIVKKVLDKLSIDGFMLLHGLDKLINEDINNKDNSYLLMCIDTLKKEVFTVNVTCLACYINNTRAKALNFHSLYMYYDKLIKDKDINFYNDYINKSLLIDRLYKLLMNNNVKEKYMHYDFDHYLFMIKPVNSKEGKILYTFFKELEIKTTWNTEEINKDNYYKYNKYIEKGWTDIRLYNDGFINVTYNLWLPIEKNYLRDKMQVSYQVFKDVIKQDEELNNILIRIEKSFSY